jgi:hypothetical protein
MATYFPLPNAIAVIVVPGAFKAVHVAPPSDDIADWPPPTATKVVPFEATAVYVLAGNADDRLQAAFGDVAYAAVFEPLATATYLVPPNATEDQGIAPPGMRPVVAHDVPLFVVVATVLLFVATATNAAVPFVVIADHCRDVSPVVELVQALVPFVEYEPTLLPDARARNLVLPRAMADQFRLPAVIVEDAVQLMPLVEYATVLQPLQTATNLELP